MAGANLPVLYKGGESLYSKLGAHLVVQAILGNCCHIGGQIYPKRRRVAIHAGLYQNFKNSLKQCCEFECSI